MWSCPECNFKAKWSYNDLANRGGPICPNCDSDLEYHEPECVKPKRDSDKLEEAKYANKHSRRIRKRVERAY